MVLRKDYQIQLAGAYAANKSDHALLLKSAGLKENAIVVKSKLLGIDSATKALLVKWIGSVPLPTGAQIVALLEALTGNARLKAEAVRILDAGGYWDVGDVEAVLAATGNWATKRVSKGWYTGGIITCDPGALTVDVTSGTGNWGGTRNISWSATSNLVITANVLNYIYVDTADSTVKNTTVKATADAQIPLAIVLANATEGIKISPYRIEISDFHYSVHHYLENIIGPVCGTGMGVSINTPVDLNIVVDTGAFHWGLFHFAYTTESPCSFTYWHKVTSVGITRWVKTVTQTDINNAKYNLDTAGVWSYANLGANKYRKDLVCVSPRTDGTIRIAVVLGQDQFNSLSAARNGAIPTLGDLETLGFASLAYVIIKQGATSIAEFGDMRPLVGRYGAMQDHGSLLGLQDNDHPQYMLKISVTINDEASIALEDYISSMTGILWTVETTQASAVGSFFLRGGVDSVTKINDPLDVLDVADTDGKLCCLADGDGTYTLKNRLGGDYNFYLTFLGS